MRLFRSTLGCWVWAFLVCAHAFASTVTLDTGEIEGAKFTVARPAKWNGFVLLIAHGFRAEEAPLIADLFPEHLAYATLLDEGWIVAKTSYRRNGTIIADGIQDLDNLRAHIAKTYGPPKRVIIEGESMGGMIAALIAERLPGDPPLYDGAVAIGAALNLRDPADPIALNLQPRIPLLFLSNQTELDGPRGYLRAKVPRDDRVVLPVLFRVARDGHVNVNQRERLVALRALNDWLDHGRDALPKPAERTDHYDATQVPPPVPSQVVFDADHRGFSAVITEISAIYGNISMNAQPADFAAVGINKNAYFQIAIGDRRYRVFYGRDFGNVKHGEWLVFPSADGFFWLARNFENAAQTADAHVGQEVKIHSYRAEPANAEPPAGEP